MQTRYRLTGRLEAGELAELYQGLRDERDRVVIKLFHPRTSDQRYARALAETQRSLASVQHDALVRVLDIGTARSRLAVIREEVDGFTLGQGLQRLTTREVLMPPPLGLYVIIQLLEVVQRAHEEGVIHGAITPGNVLLGKDGRAALTDFGVLAALLSVPELKSFAAKGRSAYRAPEVTQGEGTSVASDVYSIGSIAYELLTLREATRGNKAMSTRQSEALPPPSRLDRRLNARLDPIVMRAIDPSPSRRFKSCAEFANALRNFLSASGGMPSRADVAKLVGDLFPNEVQLQINPQVPFSEPFILSEVTGVSLPPSADRAEVLTIRPSFSDGAIPAVYDDSLPGAETIEALPAFSPYAGEEEGAAPAREAPSSVEWEAPPGAAPQKRVPMGTVSQARPAGGPSVKSRVRVVEDFSSPEPGPEPTDPDARYAPTRGEGAHAAKSRAQFAPSDPPSIEVSQPMSDSGIPYPLVRESGGRKRRMITEERKLWKAALQRRRFLAVAVGVGLVGVFCFALVLYRFGRTPGSTPGELPRKEPTAETRSQQPQEPRRAPEPKPEPKEPVQVPATAQTPVRIEPEPAAESRPVSRGVAYLTLRSNVRAHVYVDGKKLRGTTPIRRHRVAPGKREIAVVSVKTGERKEFSIQFKKGQERKLLERFQERRR